jgi:adenine-specific DNA-methyltransferase
LMDASGSGQPAFQTSLVVADDSILPSPLDLSRRRLRPIQSVIASVKTLPSTRYYGSKRRLLPWIYESIGNLRFNTALDIFGGSASVSLLLQLMRKSVTYHDGLGCNEDVARTLLSPVVAMTRMSLIELLRRVLAQDGVVARRFGGLFYTDDENRWLDGFMSLVDEPGRSREAASLLRYLVYQACLKKRPFNLFHRANLRLRTRQGVKRSFGNWTTWERTFDEHILEAFDELQGRMEDPGPAATILPPGNAEEVAEGYDFVYVDPPYVGTSKRQNWDDYWRRYHFLEGLSRYSDWEDMIDPQSGIRLPSTPPWIIEWSQRDTFPDRLFSLIEKHRRSIVVLSYVTNAHPDERIIKTFFDETFSKVLLHSKPHSHSLSRSSKRELLFIGHPKS